MSNIRVGRSHTFSRAPVLLTSCACTDLRNATYGPSQRSAFVATSSWTSPCQGTSRPCTRRDTSSLLPAFSPPSSQGCSSRGHFLFLLLQVLSRSYSLYSGEHFLFYVFVISVFSVFTYIQKVIHCAHTRSRSALLVYLGESTGSLSGLISLSISDFSIGSVQSHHIYVFCTSSLALNLEGHIYI
jgi:hypothetical protein